MSRAKKTSKKTAKTAKTSKQEKALKRAVSQLLRANEEIIARNEGCFIESGKALKAIRDGEEYEAAGCKNFETYCVKKWGYSKSYASRLIGAYEALVMLTSKLSSKSTLPTNESQVRPLTELSGAKIVKAWQQALKKSKGKKVSGETVREVVNAMLHRKSAKGKGASKTRKPVEAKKLNEIGKLVKKALTKKVKDSATELVKLLRRIQRLASVKSN